MAALCLYASLEMLQPLCYDGTHRLQGDLCRYFHEGSLQTVQVVVTLLASPVLQNSPQFVFPGVEVWAPRGAILGADKGQNVCPQPLLSCLGLWSGTGWVLLEGPSVTTEEGHVNPLALELDIYSLAHHLCKMWIFCELRRVTLANTRHFVEE